MHSGFHTSSFSYHQLKLHKYVCIAEDTTWYKVYNTIFVSSTKFS